jgi:hypothetical protein
MMSGDGTYKAFADPDHLKSSVLSASSGLIVTLLGGTFLVLYRSKKPSFSSGFQWLRRMDSNSG